MMIKYYVDGVGLCDSAEQAAKHLRPDWDWADLFKRLTALDVGHIYLDAPTQRMIVKGFIT